MIEAIYKELLKIKKIILIYPLVIKKLIGKLKKNSKNFWKKKETIFYNKKNSRKK